MSLFCRFCPWRLRRERGIGWRLELEAGDWIGWRLELGLFHVVLGDSVALEALLQLFQHCWDKKAIPEEWELAVVALLYKKGDATLPENYRPISLLPVAYKLLACMIQKRLQAGGAEQRIRPTQFGFRPNRGTAQAISIARRMLEAACESQTPGLIAIFLDWSKAFDRIRHDMMLSALKRFGIPQEMLDMIAGIYKSRNFVMRDTAGNSSKRPQSAGIAQGCPFLSLYNL